VDLSDVILAKLKESDIHFDKKSKEQGTSTRKPKYKLFCSKYLDVYFFFVLTRHKSRCNKSYRICIKQDDLKDKKPHLLNAIKSYIDASRLIFHEKHILANKLNDPENRWA